MAKKLQQKFPKKEKPDTLSKNKQVAKRGGSVAGKARKETEKEIGRSVVTRKNYLTNKPVKEIKDK